MVNKVLKFTIVNEKNKNLVFVEPKTPKNKGVIYSSGSDLGETLLSVLKQLNEKGLIELELE